MDQLPLEAFFDSPAQNLAELVYRYRLLYYLASQEPLSSLTQRSFPGAKRLAAQLGLNKPERLIELFGNLGMGKLEVTIERQKIEAVLTPDLPPSLQFSTKIIICELERSLIQASLELIVGLPVVLSQTHCWASGQDACRFETFRSSISNAPMFVPRPSKTGSPKPGGALARFEATNADNRLWLKSWHLGLLKKEFARAKRQGRPLAALYIDLDDLGEINTVFGRSMGDEAIRVVGVSLEHNCRAEDFLWHAGEDEFVVVLPETDILEAEAVAGRLAISIGERARQAMGTAISISVGIAGYPGHASSPNSLIKAAHSALYLAKYQGKGKTQTAAPAKCEIQQGSMQARKNSLSKQPATAKSRFGFIQTVSEDVGAANGENDNETTRGAARPRAIIASGKPLLLAGLEQALSQAEFQTAAAVNRAAGLCAAVEDLRPELIIADQSLASADTSALPRLLNSKNLPCKLIVLANEMDQNLVKLVVDYSIDGVIFEKASTDDIAKMLNEVYRGKHCLAPEVRSAMNNLKKCRRLLSELSERELDVLKQVAQGKTNSQISESLYITVNTVRFHLANVYQKLGVTNRTEAANYFLRQDLA